ncbi:MAG: hypothetical protein ACKOU6_02215 [Planctomycetota bacterium]
MRMALSLGGGRVPIPRILQVIGWVVCWSWFILTACLSDAHAGDAQNSSRRILTLDQDDSGRPVALAGYAKLRQVLLDELQGRVVISSEALDMARFNRAGYLDELRGWIKTKYRGFEPEVIVALGEASLDFAVSLRTELWPDVEIVFGAIPESVMERRVIPPKCTGVVHYDFRMAETIRVAQQLFPTTKRLAFIAGDVQREPFNQAVYEEFRQLSQRYETIDLTNLSMDELTSRISSLPDDTIIFTRLFLLMERARFGAVLRRCVNSPRSPIVRS